MAIHECFAGLRERLTVSSFIASPLLVAERNTENTCETQGCAGVVAGNNKDKQIDAAQETPATPETPAPPHDAEYWQELYEERAAVMEFEGELPRSEAERLAYEWIQTMKEEDRHGQKHTMH